METTLKYNHDNYTDYNYDSYSDYKYMTVTIYDSYNDYNYKLYLFTPLPPWGPNLHP